MAEARIEQKAEAHRDQRRFNGVEIDHATMGVLVVEIGGEQCQIVSGIFTGTMGNHVAGSVSKLF